MAEQQPTRPEAIFAAALEIADPAARAAYVEQTCGADSALRHEVDMLLTAHAGAEAGDFMGKQPTLLNEALATEVSAAREEQAGDRIDRYKLLEPIGEGGFGVVWMAEQQEPVRRRVALKVIKLGMDTKQVTARFEAERQALALMDHPNIARVFDGGATALGRPYFVMELIKGVPITEYCDQQRLDPRQRLELFIQVCQGVQHAHQKGIIHRDLKPSNILIAVHDDKPVPKIIDFGIAKATQQPLTDQTVFTRFQQLVGTPAYMSPEQAGMSSLDVDTRSDVYSLGVLLYELLTGRTPFSKDELLKAGFEEMCRVIREKEPPKPSTRLSTLTAEELGTVAARRQVAKEKLGRLVRGELDWIVLKALEKDRARRYETANGFARDIERYLNQEPVSAVAPSLGYQLAKFARRHRVVLGTGAAFVFMLLVATVISTWLAVEAKRAQKAESQANTKLGVQLSATEKAREAERQERVRAEEALQLTKIQEAERLFQSDQRVLGVALLAQVLRSYPSNRMAAQRLTSVLLRWPLTQPLTEPFGPETNGVVFAQFSLDGQRVVTKSEDQTGRVWDARTGQPLTEPLLHDSEVFSALFDPGGQREVPASADETARAWNPLSRQLPTGGVLYCAAGTAQFSPDGLRVVRTAPDNTARVWDARTGQPLSKPLHQEGKVTLALFSPDGQRVVTASADKTARVWDARTGDALTEPFRHEAEVAWAVFSPDGQRVLTTSVDKTARIWDARTGQPLTAPLHHEGAVGVAQFSPDGQRVVTASADKTARVWDARTGQPLTEPLRHDRVVPAAQFSPDGQRVVTISYDLLAGDFITGSENAMRIWDSHNGQPLTKPILGSALIQFSPDGQRMLTVSEHKTAQIWDARTGDPLTEPLRHEGKVDLALFSPDGQRIVTVCSGAAQVWGRRGNQPLSEPLRHKAEPRSAQFSPDRKMVVATAEGNALTEPLRHKDVVLSVQFSPDGQGVVTASADKTARVWDAHTGQPLTEPLRHEEGVTSAQFSPDGKMVVTASEDKTARVWDARTGQPLTEPLRHEEGVTSAQFSPDGKIVVTASEDKTARVWDARTGQPLTDPLRHEEGVTSAQFSPDGDMVVTASQDKTARVWDAHTGQPLTEPLRPEGGVSSAQFSPDGQQVVTASGDTARVWDDTAFSVPVPQWFLDWTDALVGRSSNPQKPGPVPPAEWLRRRAEVAKRTERDFHTKFAQWVQAEGESRTISPSSSITVSEYVSRRIGENTVASLTEAIRLSPTNASAFGRMAALVIDQDPKRNPGRLEEAEFYARYALKWDSGCSDAWRTFGVVQQERGQHTQAKQSIDRALQLHPLSAEAWQAKGEILDQSGQPAESFAAYSRVIELLSTAANKPPSLRSHALLKRARVLCRLNRQAEARADYAAFLHDRKLNADECNTLAWNMVVGSLAERDAEGGVFLAENAVRLEPENWGYRNTLGIAYYRAGRCQEAVKELQASGKANAKGFTAHDLFFLAMAHQRLGEAPRAKDYFAQALRWMEHPPETMPNNWKPELEAFKAEATELLNPVPAP